MRSIFTSLVFAVILLSGISTAYAGKSEAQSAVESVLFDMDEIGVEYVNYRVDRSGNVSMTIDETLPDTLYVEFLERLRNHPDINSVLAGKGSVCPIPYSRK